MKSIKEKAEAYDKAVERAKNFIENGDERERAIAESIFAGLMEVSEDEKIRKTLIHIVKCACDKYGIKYQGKEIGEEELLAWLETQGAHKKFRDSILIGDNVTRNKDGVLINLSRLKRMAKKDEKQGEQKPIDKVEPKFHKGEWVVDKNGTVQQILSYKNGIYKLTQGYSAQIFEDEWRMWTIQDAKDGDVLVCDVNQRPFIFKGLLDPYHPNCPVAYCGMDTEGKCYVSTYNNWWTDCNVRPATKEQRDTLEKAMADAGYAFDFEEKELKKIEQKPCMIQWKGDNLKEVIDFTGKDKNFEKWFKSFEEYEKYVHEHNDIFKLFNEDGSHYEVPVGAWIVKTPDGYNVASKAVFLQKPWSEEDENMLGLICEYIPYSLNGRIWLKELKDRFICKSNCTTTKECKPDDLPHWKKSTLPDDNTTGFNSDFFCHRGYHINYKELFEKLPKDD